MNKITMAALAMLALGATSVAAQTNGSANVTIPTVLVVSSVSDLTIADTDFDMTAFTSGNTSQAQGQVTLSTRSNVVHAVDVTGSDLTLGGVVLPLQVLDANSTWQAVGGTEAKALASLPQGVNSGLTIDFRAIMDVTLHGPGTYTGTITYTVVNNY